MRSPDAFFHYSGGQQGQKGEKGGKQLKGAKT